MYSGDFDKTQSGDSESLEDRDATETDKDTEATDTDGESWFM